MLSTASSDDLHAQNTSHQNNDYATVRYVPQPLETSVANTLIMEIFVCSRNPIWIGRGPTAVKTTPWVFICVISPTTALRLTPIFTGPGLLMVLGVTLERGVKYTEGSDKRFHLTPKALTFGDLIKVIKDHNYDKYQYIPGQACYEFWAFCVIELLVECNMLEDKREADTAAQWFKFLAVRPPKVVDSQTRQDFSTNDFEIG